MFNWILNLFCGNKKTTAEKIKEWEQPHYIKNNWPHLHVPLGNDGTCKFLFKQNDIEYKGPKIDSYHRKSPAPPICNSFYFETEGELRKAAYVIWESDVDLLVVNKDGKGDVLNNATEIYEYIDDTQEVEIV